MINDFYFIIQVLKRVHKVKLMAGRKTFYLFVGTTTPLTILYCIPKFQIIFSCIKTVFLLFIDNSLLT